MEAAGLALFAAAQLVAGQEPRKANFMLGEKVPIINYNFIDLLEMSYLIKVNKRSVNCNQAQCASPPPEWQVAVLPETQG